MSDTQANTAIDSLPELLAHALAMETEAAERYEGWLDEAVRLIGSGGTNLLPPELALIGDLHGRCRRAIRSGAWRTC